MALFGRNPFQNQNRTPKRRPKVGSPCQNCEHTHMDHSMVAPRLCLFGDCPCLGLKLDVKPITITP